MLVEISRKTSRDAFNLAEMFKEIENNVLLSWFADMVVEEMKD